MKKAAIEFVLWTYVLSGVSALTTIKLQPKQRYSNKIYAPRKKDSCRSHNQQRHFPLFVLPPMQWFFGDKDKNRNEAAKEFTGESAKEAEMMQRTAKMMEDHRRSQETAERTAAMMEELSSIQVVGKSKAGASGGMGIGGDNRRGGVKVTFNGEQRPIAVEVDPNFLFSSSMSESQGIISVDELNEAITDAMLDGYEQSGKLIEEKIKVLYGQLGLPRDPPTMDSAKGNS
mmetsp:Transcript_8582/g.14904  ORF Transcript_8582/g.14904 Transcript_8582/m.14904 type:complete len:230 (+) Transcript_8582:190-879(+)|eukprot:CAMPEP_0183735210 /NCGR_PEP_ID=MMETSP0737-20130205/46001_1 /TAXON_ID=385413 /ORGANISM="Thalassiosira miniscula, Strain CCMP1093" /LENGTH=229 /DNA_ID=CAMNT_0025968881 /DNA_START=121 /DNA_END=810 /DNA_ORIENTATION=+